MLENQNQLNNMEKIKKQREYLKYFDETIRSIVKETFE